MGSRDDGRKAVLLLARSAVTAAPIQEMERFRKRVADCSGVERVVFAFSEQGVPSLREALAELIAAHCGPILIVPLLLPAEPNFNTWLARTLQRWRTGDARQWPEIRIAPLLAERPEMADLLGALVNAGGDMLPMPEKAIQAEGSVVPAQKRRVLVCLGGPCNVAGANALWGYLRNEQERLSLRTAGEGTHTAKATCLGPCALAPVLQVWPEGTYYGGVDEAGIDRIIAEHLLGGKVVEDLAYQPTGRKQVLRR
jgi:(2Fe-2S) ferredoxin